MPADALRIRPFAPSKTAYASLAALWNRLRPAWPRDPAIWARIDQRAREPVIRHLAHDGDTLVGAAQVERAEHSALPHAYGVSVFVDEARADASALAERLHDGVVAAMRTDIRPTCLAYVGDHEPHLLRLYRARGYRTVERAALGRLELATFDEARFADRIGRVEARGYRIVRADRLVAEDPAWLPRMHALREAILADVPSDGGFAPPTEEALALELADPDRFRADLAHVAIRGDSYVACCHIIPMARQEDGGFCSLTGTLRSHRRRGVALAIKVASAAGARALGLACLTTLNEVDNPMRTLNATLGFKTQHIQHTLRCDLRPIAVD